MLDGLLTGPDPDLESIGAAEAPEDAASRHRPVTPVVIDASAGAEIVADTRRARALAGLLPVEAVGVPEPLLRRGLWRRAPSHADREGLQPLAGSSPGDCTRPRSHPYWTSRAHTGTIWLQPMPSLLCWPNDSTLIS